MNRIITNDVGERLVGNIQIAEDSSLVNDLDRKVDVFAHQCEHTNHTPIIVIRETVFDPVGDNSPESYELDLDQDAALKLYDILGAQIEQGLGHSCPDCEHDDGEVTFGAVPVISVNMGDIENRLVASLIQSAEDEGFDPEEVEEIERGIEMVTLDAEAEEELTGPVDHVEAIELREDIDHATGRLGISGVLDVLADLFATGFDGATEPNSRAATELYDTASRLELLASLKSPFTDPEAQQAATEFGSELIDNRRSHQQKAVDFTTEYDAQFYRPERPVSPAAQDNKLDEVARVIGAVLGRISRRVR